MVEPGAPRANLLGIQGVGMSRFATIVGLGLALTLFQNCGKAEFSSQGLESVSQSPTAETLAGAEEVPPAKQVATATAPTPRPAPANPAPAPILAPLAPTPQVPTPAPVQVQEQEQCIRGKGLTIAYDAATDTYKEASGDFHVNYNDLLEGGSFPAGVEIINGNVEGRPFLTAFVSGTIDRVGDNSHVGLKGLSSSSKVNNLDNNSHVRLYAPMSVGLAHNIGHLSVFGRVAIESVDCVSHLYIEHSNMRQFIGKTLYTSWVHIKR